MRIFDISMELSDAMPTYPGDPRFGKTPHAEIHADDPESCAVSALSMSSHAGTHVDAPAHFIAGGATIDRVSLDYLCGPARLIDLSGEGSEITAGILAGHDLIGIERLLLRTNEGHLSPDGAGYLIDKTTVKTLGIDMLSIEADSGPGHPVHKTLLGADPPVIIIEGLALAGVEPGDYNLWCLPLRVRDGDGAPARAVLTAGKDGQRYSESPADGKSESRP